MPRLDVGRCLLRSRLGRFTPMEGFDWACPKCVDRAAIEAAVRLGFLAEAHKLVLVTPQGLGKR